MVSKRRKGTLCSYKMSYGFVFHELCEIFQWCSCTETVKHVCVNTLLIGFEWWLWVLFICCKVFISLILKKRSFTEQFVIINMRQIFKAVSELRKISWMFLSNWLTVSRIWSLECVNGRQGWEDNCFNICFSKNGFLKPLVVEPIIGKGLDAKKKEKKNRGGLDAEEGENGA